MTMAMPRSLSEAVASLAAQPELRPLAGCTDLMVCEPIERADMPAAIDLLRIPEIHGIEECDGGLEIGATTTFSEIGESQAVRRSYPALVAAATQIGGWQIQNRATIGGNIANASPAGDSLPVLLALEASIVVVGAVGRRRIAYRDFHTGYRQTALELGELIGWIVLPPLAAGTRQFFRKVGTREAQAISKVVVALVGRMEDGHVAALKVAAGSVAATPIRLTAVEEALLGQPGGAASAARAGELAAASVEPIDDVRSTADYRRFVLGRVVRRLMLDLFA